jgi:hypothetical protein
MIIVILSLQPCLSTGRFNPKTSRIIDLITYSLLFFTLYSCSVKHDMSIKVLSKPVSFSFKAPDNSTNASLFINGEANGSFAIQVLIEGQAYDKIELHAGNIDTASAYDWYGSEMGIKYLPLNNSEGELEMQCVFYY